MLWLMYGRGTAFLSVAFALGACSSGDRSIVGEWQRATLGGITESVFFDSDGGCGFFGTDNGQTMCGSPCTYTYEGDELTLSTQSTGASTTMIQAPISGSTLTLDYGADAGGPEQFSRVNSNATNGCP
jgi:hypothetical protein